MRGGSYGWLSVRTSHFGCSDWGGCSHSVDSLRATGQGKPVTSWVHRIRKNREEDWTDVTLVDASVARISDRGDVGQDPVSALDFGSAKDNINPIRVP